MSAQQSKSVRPLPDDIESPCAKLVYLYIDSTGRATLGDLEEGLDLKRLTLYGILKTLCERDLVRQNGDTYEPATSRRA